MKKYIITEDDIAILRYSNGNLRADFLSSLKPIEPLTDAQIHNLDPCPHDMFDQQRIDFARAIERHIIERHIIEETP